MLPKAPEAVPYSSIERDIPKLQNEEDPEVVYTPVPAPDRLSNGSRVSGDRGSEQSGGKGSVRRSRSLRKLLFSGSGKWSRSPMRRSRSWLRGSQARSSQAERVQAVGFFDEAGQPAELDPPSRGVNG